MDRKLFSLAGVLIAVFSFAVSCRDAEAGRRLNRCNPQTDFCGCPQPRFTPYNGLSHGRPFGDGGLLSGSGSRQDNTYGLPQPSGYSTQFNYAVPPSAGVMSTPTVAPPQASHPAQTTK